MRSIVAVFDKKGGQATRKAAIMLKTLKQKGADTFGLATPTSIDLKAEPEKLRIQELESQTAVGHVFTKILADDKPQPIMLESTALVFDGRIYQPQEFSDIESVVNAIEDDVEAGVNALMCVSDGSFAFAIAKPKQLIVGRDSLGLYPLYYGENKDTFAVASERKALWKIGINKTFSFPPRHIFVVGEKGVKTTTIKPAKNHCKRCVTMDEAVKNLKLLLEESAKQRFSGLKTVAVAFSGGLDSSLTAFLAKKAGVKTCLIHVSLENQAETLQAKEAATMLDLPLHTYTYSEEDLKQTIPAVLLATENAEPLNVSIGVPLFWAAEKASELGLNMLSSGQGADELFGGYKRYLTLYSRYGESLAEKAIIYDVSRMHEANFERDSKICSFNNVELRLPFATYPLVNFAMKLPLNLKIESRNDLLRKAVLRKTAEKMGLPPQIAYRPKKAIQYATGVSKAIKKLAKREKLSLKQFLDRLFQDCLKE
ncbi:asparagine synthetase B [Candidatus Bathyarchaeota archaeon]|nr:asparagine synthetase B [Candidatus Bathyarchaeota archaeon]